MGIKQDLRLYLVTDRSFIKNRSLYEQVREALYGGVTMVQFREKSLGSIPEQSKELIKEAEKIRQLCYEFHVPFIVNDYVEIAKMLDADGVHVGQADMEASQVRQLLGDNKIVGVTVKTVEQALAAMQQGASYLGSGAAFATGTKTDTKVIDHQVLKDICHSVSIPVVGIGGITEHNAEQLKGLGLSGIAVVSGILAQPKIEQAAKTLYRMAGQIIQ